MRIEKAELRLFASIAGIVAVVGLAMTGLFWVQGDLERSVRELNTKSEQALLTAVELNRRCVKADERQRVSALQADIEARLRDLESPAMVVAGLSETCRRFGVTVMEISPVMAEPGAAPTSPLSANAAKRYRLVLGGTYRQLAELLDGCARQRLPARVREFSISPVAPTGSDHRLTAELVLECFRLKQKDVANNQGGGQT